EAARQKQPRSKCQQKELLNFIDIARSRVFSEDRYTYLTTVIAEALKSYGARCHTPPPPSPIINPAKLSSSTMYKTKSKTDGPNCFVLGIKAKSPRVSSSSPSMSPAPTLPDEAKPQKKRRKYTKKVKGKKTGGTFVWLSRLD